MGTNVFLLSEVPDSANKGEYIPPSFLVRSEVKAPDQAMILQVGDLLRVRAGGSHGTRWDGTETPSREVQRGGLCEKCMGLDEAIR